MSVLSDALAYNSAAFIANLGQAITVRNVTVVAGPNPFPNPPVHTGLVFNGASSLGAATISLRSNNLNGRLLPGDALAIGTDPTLYMVAGTVNSSAGTFATVPITPVLAKAHNDGEAVVASFIADYPVANALVTSFPTRLVNGTSIQMTDCQARFLASAVPFEPETTDKIFVGAEQFSIIAVKSIQSQNSIYMWSCHLRR